MNDGADTIEPSSGGTCGGWDPPDPPLSMDDANRRRDGGALAVPPMPTAGERRENRPEGCRPMGAVAIVEEEGAAPPPRGVVPAEEG